MANGAKIVRMVAFSLCVVVAFAMETQQTALSPPESQNLSSLAVHVDVLCPYNVICRQGEPRLTAPGSDRTGCCTDCSCEDDCGLTERCCDPKMDSRVDRSHQKCLYPSTVIPLEEEIAYNMVVDGYSNGIGEECGTTSLVNCGDDVTASALGAMYPVYSPKTGRIYVNMKCARCHGLIEQDVVAWNAYLVCEDSKFIDASTYFQYFEDGTMTPSCSIRFSYPGPSSDLQLEQCYDTNRLIQNCSADDGDFHLPDELNMTYSQVAEACNSDFTSPVLSMGWYKNVFCRLCHAGPKYRPTFACNRLGGFDASEKFVDMSFVAVLSPEMAVTRTAMSRPKSTVVRRACSMHDGTDCRLAYCPSGKMPDSEGRCQYLIDNWKTDRLGMSLKLIPRRPLTMTAVRNTDFATVLANKTLSVSPWSRRWRIEHFMSTSRTDVNNASVVEYFHVKLIYKQNIVNITRISNDIEDAIKHEWLLSLDGLLLAHRQDFSELTNVDAFKGPYYVPEFIYLTEDRHVSNFKDIPIPEFEMLYAARYGSCQPPTMAVTKMFFCDQVALVPGEYELDIRFRVLRHNVTGRIFYPGEIAIVYDKGLTHVPKLCVQDVGFHVVSARGDAGRCRMTLMALCWMLMLEALIVGG